MAVYADSSFLISLLVEDGNSAEAKTYMSKNPERLIFSPLHRLEVRNGIRLRVFRGEIDTMRREAAFRQIDEDLLDEVFQHTPLNWPLVLRRAEELGSLYGESTGNRAADILHVACALELGSRQFLSFDRRQRALAKVAGLKVKP
jgi:predicted nucleic acid-binding protein